MFKKMVRAFLDKVPIPYVSKLRRDVKAQGAHAAGDYFSPIPNREEVRRRLDRGAPDSRIVEVDLRDEEQKLLLRRLAAHYAAYPYAGSRRSGLRFDPEQTCFGPADAVLLYAMLAEFRPKTIIEVGTGNSSALILDTVASCAQQPAKLTFVEPFADNRARLLARFSEQDKSCHRILAKKVQDVELETFAKLNAGDLLFVASSHVMKFGGDLQYLFFEVLPALPRGVIVQFHGVHFPFEYPAEWIDDGKYWNESYFLRGFLAYNDTWKVLLFNDYAAGKFKDFLAVHMPLVLTSRGSSLYLSRIK